MIHKQTRSTVPTKQSNDHLYKHMAKGRDKQRREKKKPKGFGKKK